MLASNKKKLITILIVTLVLLLILVKTSYAIVRPTNDFYINDYANLLDEETRQYIINTNKTLNQKTGAQIVVVTVKNLEGKSLEEYATEAFRQFGIGDKTKNNGVLLLLALEERKFRIEVGYGLEGALPDGKTGRIQDEYIIPYLKENNWKDGIRNGFNAVLKEVKSEYNIEFDSEEPVEEDKYDWIIYLIVFIIILIISFKGGFPRRHVYRRRIFFWRWLRWKWLIWRRRIFWWRRKLKGLLIR